MANSKLIDFLNVLLKDELSGINQYFLHAKMCQNWGYTKLYHAMEKNAIVEMKHAEVLIERILFLDGKPNITDLGSIKIGNNVKEQFENDLAAEKEALGKYNEGILLAEKHKDAGTRDLLTTILKDEEGHYSFADTQLNLINKLGEDKYLQLQVTDAEAALA